MRRLAVIAPASLAQAATTDPAAGTDTGSSALLRGSDLRKRVAIPAAGLMAALLAAALASAGGTAVAGVARAAKRPPLTAYVSDYYPGTVTPIRLRTGRILKPVKVGRFPTAVAITPDGRTLYVVNHQSLSLVRTSTNKAVRKVNVPGYPWGSTTPIVFTPDSKIGFVSSDSWNGTITPITTASGKALRPIRVGHDPQAMAVTPNGRMAYVANYGSGTVTPISLASGRAVKPVKVGDGPSEIVITPDGKMAHVISAPHTVTPIRIATRKALKPIPVAPVSSGLALAPDGKIAYAIDWLYGVLTPIRVATGQALRRIHPGALISGVAFTPDSTLAYVASIGGTLTPIRTRDGRRGKVIKVHQVIEGIAIMP